MLNCANMTIDWTKVRRVICNDRMMGYKPDIYAFKKITERMPDAQILGFGVYQKHLLYKVWYVLVFSKYFREDEQPGLAPVSMNDTPWITAAVLEFNKLNRK